MAFYSSNISSNSNSNSSNAHSGPQSHNGASPSSSSCVVEALRKQLDDKNEMLFDLQATLATIQAETYQEVQQVQQAASQSTRNLQEQLRRVQQEANVARSLSTQLQGKLAVQQQQQQQQQQQANPHSYQTHPTSSSIVTPTHLLADNSATAAAAVTTAEAPVPQSGMDTQHRHRQHQPSTGQRLALHLLQTMTSTAATTVAFAFSNKPDLDATLTRALTDSEHDSTNDRFRSAQQQQQQQQQQHHHVVLHQAAQQWMAQLGRAAAAASTDYPGDSTNTNLLTTQQQLVDRLVELIVTVGRGETTAAAAAGGQPLSFICSTTNTTNLALLQWLLQQLHDALVYSTTAQRVLWQGVVAVRSTIPTTTTTTTLTTTTTPFASENTARADTSHNNPPPRKRRRLCRLQLVRSVAPDAAQSSTTDFGVVADSLRNPLSAPAALAGGPTSYNATGSNHNKESNGTHAQLYVALAHNLGRYIRLDHAKSNDNTTTSATLAVSMQSMRIVHLLLQQQTATSTDTSSLTACSLTAWSKLLMDNNNNNSNNSNNNLVALWLAAATAVLDRPRPADSHSNSVRRLAERTFTTSESNATHGDDTSNTNNASQQQQSARIESLAALDDSVLLDWMTQALHLLNGFWKQTAAGSDNSSTFEWWESGHARALTAVVLDMLDRWVLLAAATAATDLQQQQQRQAATPFCWTCLTWLMGLLQDSAAGFLLLRTCMATTHSTVTAWHRAESAVGVVCRLLHATVVRQDSKDHLPTVSRAVNDQLSVTRDTSVRFLDGILKIVQEDRRALERQGVSLEATKVVGFWNVVSEYREMYTSAAALLLTVSDQSSCKVDCALTAMLRMQMEELVMDEEEQEELVQ